MKVSRREVIKTFALGAVFSQVAGKSWAEASLVEMNQAPGFTAGFLRIDLDDFPALAQPYGSVRVGTFPVGAERRTDAWLKPILINRGAGEELYVVSAVCTHEECILPPMNPSLRFIVCPEDDCGHGSQYEVDGEVREGPAGSALTRYEFTREGSVLKVAVPDLFYDLTYGRSAAGSRLQIRFVAFYQTRYVVYFRETVDGPGELVNFALTEDGVADVQEVTGNFDSEYVTLYLDRPGRFGFYQVAVKTEVV